MNEVLQHIERELVAGIRRDGARRRRHRRLAATVTLAVAGLLTAAVGIAAVSGPIDRLLGGGSDLGQRPGSPRLDIRLTDPGGLRWRATVYVSKDGLLSTTAAAEGVRDRLPHVNGANGFVIATVLQRGPLARADVEVVRAMGKAHYIVAGTVDARERSVVVDLGGERRTAMLSAASLTIPVEVLRRCPASTSAPRARRRGGRTTSAPSSRTAAAAMPRPRAGAPTCSRPRRAPLRG